MIQRLPELMTSSRVLLVLFALCLMAAVAWPVAASSPGEEELPGRQAPEASTEGAVTSKTMRVIYDPETGAIISVPFRETEGLSVPLSQHVLMVRVKPDGSLETVCTNHSHAAEKFLRGTSDGADAQPRDR
jgi:hypothetical protein